MYAGDVGIAHLSVNPQSMSEAEGILFALLTDIHMLIDPIRHLPRHSQVVLPFTAGSNHHITLVHGLHHLLRLFEIDVVEGRMSNHTLYVSYKEKTKFVLRSHKKRTTNALKRRSMLTGSLLFLLLLLFLFNIIRFSIKVIIGVFGKFPLVVLVAQIRCSASEIHIELFYVDLHDAAVHGHARLNEENQAQVFYKTKVLGT